MLIKDWMTTPVVSVGPEESMMKASKILKDNTIRRLPVVDESGKLIGIVSDTDIKEAGPSKATTLDVHELYYLLSEIKVKEIMSSGPMALKPEDSVEKAAVFMHGRRLGGLPIVDDDNVVVGMLTEMDIFRVLQQITRVKDGGWQMGFNLERTPGALQPILADIVNKGGNILSIITAYPKGQPGRVAYLRIEDMPETQLRALKAHLESTYELQFFHRDELGELA